MALMSNWHGADVELKDHKPGKGDRRNQWNTDGSRTRRDASWRTTAIRRRGVRSFRRWRKCCAGATPGTRTWTRWDTGVYLFWVGVGAGGGVEDGSHYRPNHHAGSSQRIYESIEAVEKHASGQGGRHAEEVRALIRRLHPRLPAFTAEFTQSVPAHAHS